MTIFNQSTINNEYIKVRWKEPYVSHSLNRKLFGTVPKGVYSGFVITPNGLNSGRGIDVVQGTVSGGYGSGMTGGYVSGAFDEATGSSIAIYQSTDGHSITVNYPSNVTTIARLDCSGLDGSRVYVALGVTYAVSQETSGKIILCNAAELNSYPSYIVIGYIDVPNIGTPIDLTMIGYNDTNYPRLTPIGTPFKAGFLSAAQATQISQMFAWQNLLDLSIDPNSNYVLQITPSQGTYAGRRIFSYVQASIASKFPRATGGAYNGGANNDQLTKLNLQTGVISGPHQIQTSFTTPPIVGTPNQFQVGLISLDAGDNLQISYGNAYSTRANAVLDDNLPIAGASFLQIGAFVAQTNGAGVLQPLALTDLMARRPFLNVGGGGSGDASSLQGRLEDQLTNSPYEFMTPNIFNSTGSNRIASATATLNLAANPNTYLFSAAGQNIVSTQMLDSDFLSRGVDVGSVDLTAAWFPTAIDTAAIYQVSRDGGANFQTVTMARVGLTDTFTGSLSFADEGSYATQFAQASAGTDSQLNATTTHHRASLLVAASATVLKQATLYLKKTGAPTGKMTVQIVRDASGVPSSSPTDVIYESSALDISTIATTMTAYNFTLNAVLPSGTYYAVITMDATYAASFTASDHIDVDSTTTGMTWVMTSAGVWSSVSGILRYTITGRALDLRVKVTSGSSNVGLVGYGIFHGKTPGVLSTGFKAVERQVVLANTSPTNFTVSKFVPNMDLLKVYVQGTGQVFTSADFSINGQTVIFPAGTFSLPTDTVLIFDQNSGSTYDSSDTNASNIVQLQAVTSAQLQSVVDGSQLVTVPYTTIQNRAQIMDPTKDLGLRMGVDRVMTQQIYQLQNEFGPNGEPVFGVLNDDKNMIRFVGNFANVVESWGSRVMSAAANPVGDYVEITFYGTGLNWLTNVYNSTMNAIVSVDGGSFGSNITTATYSSILGNRNYATNMAVNVANGLAIGLHTVRIQKNGTGSNFDFYGFEILNASSTVLASSGNIFANSKKLPVAAQSLAYNSHVTGTKGGRVLSFIDQSGVFDQLFQPVDASSKTLASTDHSNEEIARIYSPREFGASRSVNDDFNYGTGAAMSTMSFTLDDGSTTLFTNSGRFYNAFPMEALQFQDSIAGKVVAFTFVGTGLDLELICDSVATRTIGNISIDGGASLGTISISANSRKLQKICSGLPYGTHLVKLTATAGANDSLGITKLVVYQPKTPTLPGGAFDLGAYNVMANFVANSTVAPEALSTGVLRKNGCREFIFANGTGGTSDWVINPGAQYVSAFELATDRQNAFVEYTFFGTGFDFRFTSGSNRSSNISVLINGVAATTANYASMVSSVYGTSITFAAGVLNQNASGQNGCGLVISGLPLAKYTVRLTNNTASSYIIVDAFDIITPIHSHKPNLFADVQNTLNIGSQGIEDHRTFLTTTPEKKKAWAQAVGITSTPSTSATSFVPIPDMSVTMKTQGGLLQINYSVMVANSSGGFNSHVQAYMDGVALTVEKFSAAPGGNYDETVSDSMIVPASAGVHKIDLYWRVDGNSTRSNNIYRTLSVREL